MSPPPREIFLFRSDFSNNIENIAYSKKKTSHCSVDLSLLAIFSLNAISYLYKKNLRPDRSKTFMYRGWGIRTPIDGFGDRCSAIELIPYINKNTCTFKTTYCITSELLFITWTTVRSSSSCSFTRTTNALGRSGHFESAPLLLSAICFANIMSSAQAFMYASIHSRFPVIHAAFFVLLVKPSTY